MTNKLFKLKEFNISHSQSSMKVGTDAMILGSYASVIKPKSILDIGTGCGILALMMAQKYPTANITGIDIHSESIEEARSNFENSKFNNLHTLHTSLQDFNNLSEIQYDLIISNPPFFQDDLKSEINSRNLARHNDQLGFKELIHFGSSLLNENGLFWFILPSRYEDQIDELIENSELKNRQKIHLFNDNNSYSVRTIFCLSKSGEELPSDRLTIRKNNSYTDEYIDLTKGFHFNQL
jgi:tRNA1Val (adenine37-N6)-methyltransferase